MMNDARMLNSDSRQKAEKKAWMNWVFVCTFLNYAYAHWTRKSYTNVKVALMHAGVSPLTVTAMDSGFMFTYAGGSFITGMLGDRFSPSMVVGLGLLGSTVCLLLIALGASTSIISNPAICGSFFLTVQLLHGAFQATGGPVNTAIMDNWIDKNDAESRGTIFGLWTCHQYVGDIAAALASAALIASGFDWKWCIVVPAVLNGFWVIPNLYYLPNRPTEVPELAPPVEAAGSINNHAADAAAHKPAAPKAEPIGLIEAFMLPNVMNYAVAFGFFKLVNYAMFFQLPVILSSHFDVTTSNLISILYSVGMMPGGVVCGYVSDLSGGRRACVIALFMAVLCPLLWVFAIYMQEMPITLLLALLCLMGCLVGGPNNIITSAVATDLANDPIVKSKGQNAAATVTGIINGSGSVTAAIGQLAIPVLYGMGLTDGVGYRYVWYFLIVCTVTGTALMGSKIYKELAPPSEVVPIAAGQPGKAHYSAVPQRETRV